METYKYRAFISYDHKDERVAARLHRSLEAYPVPKSLAGRHSGKISPIFRDVAELTAHHSLSDKIQDAISQSQYLIVLCSPGSKSSHWVNQEIKLFRDIHGNSAILCALIEGTPQNSFPPALTETGEEPLAANLSPKSFRLGVSQLAASILGVGLDDLVQRDVKKLRRRVTLVTASAISALLMMGTLTWTAIDARQLAEQRRLDAEGQIEFMLTDLKDELDAVGSLKALNVVGERAVSYYDNYKLSDHDDDALSRRARVFILLGKTQRDLGKYPEADTYFEKAFKSTKALEERSPRDPQRIFNHSQSSYWVGTNHYSLKNYAEAKSYFDDYLKAANRLSDLENGSERSLEELSYAHTNMGAVELKMSHLETALAHYSEAMSFKKKLLDAEPNNKRRLKSLANAYGHLAGIQLKYDDISSAVTSWEKAFDLVSEFQSETKDADLAQRQLSQLRSLSRLYFMGHETKKSRTALEKGQGIAASLLAIDPNNVEVKYESSLLDMLEFEFAYFEEQTELAAQILGTITQSFNELPDGFRQTSKYQILDNMVSLFPLYLAISESDNHKIEMLARERLQGFVREEVTSGAALLESPSRLPAAILINKILKDSEIKTLLLDVCETIPPHIGYQKKVILSATFNAEQCLVLEGKTLTQQHIIHTVLGHLN